MTLAALFENENHRLLQSEQYPNGRTQYFCKCGETFNGWSEYAAHLQDPGIQIKEKPSEPQDDSVDPINHPPHYTHGKIETIDVIEDWGLGYHLGQVIKYVSRAEHKGELT